MRRVSPPAAGVLSVLLAALIWHQGVRGLQRVCYLTIDHRPFAVNGFEGDFCTHVNVMPVNVDVHGSVFPSDARDVAKYAKVQELRSLNPDLKILATLIVVPGQVFSEAVGTARQRSVLSRNILRFLLTHNFDGVDIDWEFPVFSSGHVEDRDNFIALLQEIRSLFQRQAPDKLLSVAVAADVTIVNLGYDAAGINSSVDYVNLMSYDYTDWHWYYPFSGHNAALSPFSRVPYLAALNTQFSANLWHGMGVAKSKIMVGIPTYSHTFRLLSSRLHYPGAPCTSEGPELTYGEVCRFLRQPGSTRVWDAAAAVPYAFNASVWVTYEDQESAAKKAVWIRDNHFGGSMTYNINNDDMDGSCGPNGQPFALHRVIRSLLQ